MKKSFLFFVCGIVLCSRSSLFGAAGPKDIDYEPQFTPEETQNIIATIQKNIDYQQQIIDANGSGQDKEAARKMLKDLIKTKEKYEKKPGELMQAGEKK